MDILPRSVIFALIVVANGPIVVGLSTHWVYLNGLAEIQNGKVVLAFLAIANPPIDIDLSQ